MINHEHDVIVVGSGMAGVHVALSLLEEGYSVTMLDPGTEEPQRLKSYEGEDYLTIRKSDLSQWKLLLGNSFEGIPWGKNSHSLTPSRQYITRNSEQFSKVISNNFQTMQSYIEGGLGNGWGAGSFAFSPDELELMGLNPQRMKSSYQEISQEIGLCDGNDDLSTFASNGLKDTHPPLNMDNSTTKIYETYQQRKIKLNKNGFFAGQVPMAIKSSNYKYWDLDFYTDESESVYRPWITLNKLKNDSKFKLMQGYFATQFNEINEKVEISVINVTNQKEQILKCNWLILAAGAFNSAKIVNHSLKIYDRRPFLSNRYNLMVALNLKMHGKVLSTKKTSFSQLDFYQTKNYVEQWRMGSIYTYRSLMFYKLIKEIPFFSTPLALDIIRTLSSMLTVISVNHPDKYNKEKTYQISNENIPGLNINYFSDKNEIDEDTKYLSEIKKNLIGLFCLPLTTQTMTPGTSVHYGGTLGTSVTEKRGSVAPSGKIHGTNKVFVSDSSAFNFLPAGGLTLSIMAYARLVGKNLSSEDKKI